MAMTQASLGELQCEQAGEGGKGNAPGYGQGNQTQCQYTQENTQEPTVSNNVNAAYLLLFLGQVIALYVQEACVGQEMKNYLPHPIGMSVPLGINKIILVTPFAYLRNYDIAKVFLNASTAGAKNCNNTHNNSLYLPSMNKHFLVPFLYC